jgi:antitoxin component YwqK of YwqJK toxin-antitoxin module
MKLVLAIIFIPLFLFSQELNQVDSKGRKQGSWAKTYPNSRVYQYKGQFKDDKPIGTFTYFYESTKVKAIIKHNANSNRSEAFFYHENGNLMSYGIYRDMKKDSVWLNFLPSGRLSNTESYKNDLLHGKKVVYYVPENLEDKSRLIATIYNYSNGKLNGETIDYFDIGSVKMRGNYENDKKVGVWEYYHLSGKKMMLERYKNGVRHGWCFAYDETGKETGKMYYYYGKKLEGKELEEKMKQMKAKGINPNE